MKTKAFFFVLVCAYFISCNNQNTSTIIGTWQLVSGKYISADTTIIYPGNRNGNHWKIITKSHFASIYQDTISIGLFSTGFNGGTYTYLDGVYAEIFSHSSMSNSQLGTEMKFEANVEGDKLTIFPYSADGKVEDFGVFEEYKRIE